LFFRELFLPTYTRVFTKLRTICFKNPLPLNSNCRKMLYLKSSTRPIVRTGDFVL
jgi:hypothetical protein